MKNTEFEEQNYCCEHFQDEFIEILDKYFKQLLLNIEKTKDNLEELEKLRLLA